MLEVLLAGIVVWSFGACYTWDQLEPGTPFERAVCLVLWPIVMVVMLCQIVYLLWVGFLEWCVAYIEERRDDS